MIAERKSWPILYHFSHVRQNIVNWFPLGGQGSGDRCRLRCDHRALCDKAQEVICVDLSRKRSLINAWRNRDRENIRILMGNFQDIETTLEETMITSR